MDGLLSDVRFALRSMRRSPGFTAAVIVSLALGIGATTAIFSAVYGVLLRPLPYADGDRLAIVYSTMTSRGIPESGTSLPDYHAFRDRGRSFSGLAAAHYQSR